MIDLTTQLNEKAMILVPIIAVLVQEFKRSPWIAKLADKIPIYTLIAAALGVGGAFLQGLGNPVVTGIMIALMASGAYSAAKVANGKTP